MNYSLSTNRAPIFKDSSATTPIFFLLCLYILAQSFMIPFVAIGPSWAIWPTFADVALLLLLGVSLLLYKPSRNSFLQQLNRGRGSLLDVRRDLGRAFVALLLVATFGVIQTAIWDDSRESVMYGLYFLYRFYEFGLLFWCLSQIGFTDRRLLLLRFVVDAVLVITSVGVILTFFGIISLAGLTAHLPQTADAAGPWIAYLIKEQYPEDGRGVGFVGYNHAYAAVQILGLTALRITLTKQVHNIWSAVILLPAVLASFLTESRAGFAALIFFLLTQYLRNVKAFLGALAVCTLVLTIVEPSKIGLGDTLERQQTILSATEEDNLSGRPKIWETYTSYLFEHPASILVGSGLGSSYPVTPNRSCHMTPLQYLFELGIIGAALYLFIVTRVGVALYRSASESKPLFWAFISLQVASLTMETFYPIPYLGHFLGLCLVALCVELSKDTLSCSKL